jgi:hypothetical protein
MRHELKWMAVVVALVAGAAGAEERRVERAAQYGGQGWSVLSGQTVGAGANALTAQLGYPGVSVGFLHGLAPNIDLGFRVGFNYGYEGIVTAVYPGIKAEVRMRIGLLDTGKLNLGLDLGAGGFGYFDRFGGAVAGMSIPVGLKLGIPVASALTAHVAIEAPMFVTFGGLGGLTLPLLFGGGLEYFIDRNFALTFGVRMGPALNPTGYAFGPRASFAFEALIGVAFKL